MASASEIMAAVEAATAGIIALDADAIAALIAHAPSMRDEAPDDNSAPRDGQATKDGQELESLTPREMEVLAMLAEGLGNKEIAWRMGISEHTVKFHVASILGKMDASSRTEAVALGIRRGLIML